MKTTVIEYINRIQEGGAEALIRDYALFLNKEKFKVIIVCNFITKNSSIYKTLKDNNINVIQLYKPFIFVNRIIKKLFGSKYDSFLLKRIIKQYNPNTLHIHLESLEAIYNLRNILKNIKILYTCHNLPKTMIGDDLPNEKKAAEYLIKHNNMQIIALHDDMAIEINKLFNISNTVVINNAIDFNKYTDVKITKQEKRKELGISEKAYVIGNIGRLSYQKNQKFILEVFLDVLITNKDAFLLLIGTGPLKNEILRFINEHKINDKVLLLSHRNDIPELLKTMDVFLFPSNYEGLGIVLIEAQLTNLPCIVSDKIPKEAFISDLVQQLSLNQDISIWSNSCLHPKTNIFNYYNKNKYNIEKEILKLEKLYK